jgi:hypothetical protein
MLLFGQADRQLLKHRDTFCTAFLHVMRLVGEVDAILRKWMSEA